MCGIAGILYRGLGKRGEKAPIGAQLINMLDALKHRGIDSTGVTVVGEPVESNFILRLWASQDRQPSAVFNGVSKTLAELGAEIRHQTVMESFLRLLLDYEGDLPQLAKTLVNHPGLVIHSLGNVSEVIKDVGPALNLDVRHKVSGLLGTHGIGHVRLATESRVDITHSHPFWAFPFPDITVVHNGQLTNYHKLRRVYEQFGHHFQTDNDSELIAVYLADKLAKGSSLEDALYASLEDLDGTFTYLVSTPNGMGIAKDQWSAKPLVVMESSDIVAVASEEVALRRVFPQEIERIEPQQSEVMTWYI